MEPPPPREDVPNSRRLGVATLTAAPLAAYISVFTLFVPMIAGSLVQAPLETTLLLFLVGLLVSPMALVFGVIIGIPITIVIWLPMFFVIKQLGLNGRNAMLAGGLATGLLAVGLFQATGLPLPLISELSLPAALLWYGGTGVLASYIFWLIRRPDRDAARAQSAGQPSVNS